MSWIIFAIVSGFIATLLNTGCASNREFHMRDCKKILSLEEKDEGERSCKKFSIWD